MGIYCSAKACATCTCMRNEMPDHIRENWISLRTCKSVPMRIILLFSLLIGQSMYSDIFLSLKIVYFSFLKSYITAFTLQILTSITNLTIISYMERNDWSYDRGQLYALSYYDPTRSLGTKI